MRTFSVLECPWSLTRKVIRASSSYTGCIHLWRDISFEASWIPRSLLEANKESVLEKPLATADTIIPCFSSSVIMYCKSISNHSELYHITSRIQRKRISCTLLLMKAQMTRTGTQNCSFEDILPGSAEQCRRVSVVRNMSTPDPMLAVSQASPSLRFKSSSPTACHKSILSASADYYSISTLHSAEENPTERKHK